ncbi:MAG: ClpXP protease specificity-enhancing factor SspB [Candidatus Thiodiazotropha sp.]
MSDTDQPNPYETPTKNLLDIHERLSKSEYEVYLSITQIEPMSDLMQNLQYCYYDVLLVGDTVRIIVDAKKEDCGLAKKYINDDKIILDISPGAISNFTWFENAMQFEARFNGKRKTMRVPMDSLMWICSAEINYGYDVSQFK